MTRMIHWLAALALSASPLALWTHISGHISELRASRLPAADPVGLTVADGRHGPVVTSLMNAGPAERGGISVNDEVRAVYGRTVIDAEAVWQDIRRARACRVTIDLRRGNRPVVATLNRCG